MKNTLVNSLLSFAFALVVVSIIGFFVTIPKNADLRDINSISINEAISSSINIKDKVVVKKIVNNTNYLNAWKLSATIISAKPFAMVLKGRDAKVLKIADTLEGYTVKEIHKDKVLFSTSTDDTWLYIKTQKVNTQNLGMNTVMPTVDRFSIRQASFKRNLLRPERLLKTVNIMPDMKDNVFQGMKVASLLEGSFLYVYGLRQDDVIKKINGKKLLSIADGITAYQSIASSTRFSISVLRDNKIEELKYEIVK